MKTKTLHRKRSNQVGFRLTYAIQTTPSLTFGTNHTPSILPYSKHKSKHSQKRNVLEIVISLPGHFQLAIIAIWSCMATNNNLEVEMKW